MTTETNGRRAVQEEVTSLPEAQRTRRTSSEEGRTGGPRAAPDHCAIRKCRKMHINAWEKSEKSVLMALPHVRVRLQMILANRCDLKTDAPACREAACGSGSLSLARDNWPPSLRNPKRPLDQDRPLHLRAGSSPVAEVTAAPVLVAATAPLVGFFAESGFVGGVLCNGRTMGSRLACQSALRGYAEAERHTHPAFLQNMPHFLRRACALRSARQRRRGAGRTATSDSAICVIVPSRQRAQAREKVARNSGCFSQRRSVCSWTPHLAAALTRVGSLRSAWMPRCCLGVSESSLLASGMSLCPDMMTAPLVVSGSSAVLRPLCSTPTTPQTPPEFVWGVPLYGGPSAGLHSIVPLRPPAVPDPCALRKCTGMHGNPRKPTENRAADSAAWPRMPPHHPGQKGDT